MIGNTRADIMTLPHLTFILGGATSGKSAFAESLVFADGAARVYVATAQIWDDEMRAKVDRHHTMRGPDWITHETPFHVQDALSLVKADQVVLLDCATMWLSNHLLAENNLESETETLLQALNDCKGRVVVVSNEVGMGIVPDNALARQFREEQGRLNQHLATASDLAVFVVAGLPQVLKGHLP